MSRTRSRTILEIPVPHPFDFRLMIFSHGWAYLDPFRWEAETRSLIAVLKTAPGWPFGVRISSRGDNAPGQRLCVDKAAGGRMVRKDTASLEQTIRWMFRLDEDFTPFQARCRQDPALDWVARYGLGAFLRNGDLFEDFVKVLLTTNVSWAGTRLMNQKLIEHLGRPVEPAGGFDPPLRAFPDPEDVAAATESFLRKKIRVGYRAPFLIEFAQSVASGALRLAAFDDPGLSSEDLALELSKLKGFGPYAVSALFLTLGRYDRLILDSWTRKKSAERHFKSGRATDRSIRRVYEQWGPWKTLACWFECAYDTWYKDELTAGGEKTRS